MFALPHARRVPPLSPLQAALSRRAFRIHIFLPASAPTDANAASFNTFPAYKLATYPTPPLLKFTGNTRNT